MKIKTTLLSTVAAVAAIAIPFAAKADTVNARCDLYPLGVDHASAVVPCTFSQRQGAVTITLQDGTTYDLSPTGNQPGNYRDQNGRAAYRQSGLGSDGQIYRLADRSIYVYWDTAGIPAASGHQGSTPTAGTRYAMLRASSSNTRINLRSSSTINSSTAGYGLPGDRVELRQCVPDRDTAGSDLNWCQVRFPSSGSVGWVRSDFIQFEDGGE